MRLYREGCISLAPIGSTSPNLIANMAEVEADDAASPTVDNTSQADLPDPNSLVAKALQPFLWPIRVPSLLEALEYSLFSLALGLTIANFLFPLTGFTVCATFLVYYYLLHEHRFNAALVRCNVPRPDDQLPTQDEWTAKRGLKRLKSASFPDDENCVVCYSSLEDPVQITQCGHIFCAECVTAWHAQGHRT